jgi:hypothetical protein
MSEGVIKAVYLEWIDSTTFPGWRTVAKDLSPMPIVSFGIVASEDKESITIATSQDDQTPPSFEGLLCIPKFAITKRKAVKL